MDFTQLRESHSLNAAKRSRDSNLVNNPCLYMLTLLHTSELTLSIASHGRSHHVTRKYLYHGCQVRDLGHVSSWSDRIPWPFDDDREARWFASISKLTGIYAGNACT